MSLWCTFLSWANTIADAIIGTYSQYWSWNNFWTALSAIGVLITVLLNRTLLIKQENELQYLKDDQIYQRRLHFLRSDIYESYCKGKCIKDFYYIEWSKEILETINVMIWLARDTIKNSIDEYHWILDINPMKWSTKDVETISSNEHTIDELKKMSSNS